MHLGQFGTCFVRVLLGLILGDLPQSNELLSIKRNRM